MSEPIVMTPEAAAYWAECLADFGRAVAEFADAFVKWVCRVVADPVKRWRRRA